MSRSWFGVVLSICLFVSAPSVRAQPLLLWPLARGCDADSDLTQAVHARLAARGGSSLGTVPVVGSPQEAVRELKSACAGVSGRVLGGTIEPSEGRGLERFRLWLVDLSTEQVASVDGLCQDKDCKLSDEVGWKAMELLDKPRFGPLSDTPSFCQPPPPVTITAREWRHRPSHLAATARPSLMMYSQVPATVRKPSCFLARFTLR